VTGGKVKLVKPEDIPYYGWDNKYGTLVEEIKEFNASKFLVSNQKLSNFSNKMVITKNNIRPKIDAIGKILIS